ncbi:CGNR zinc finger domain-containing protein [Spongiimicrobium sp. 2-473A-2-J]|uniref:CGNR zinc finger domain-containing protein n=1 Tax=Eudoraea algarum TaxID=3417568 RepID=UPI003D369F65
MSLPDKIRFDGGKLCLDYVNTIHDRFERPLRDYLQTPDDLIRWSLQAGILTTEDHRILEKTVLQKSANAEAFFAKAIQFRQVLYRLFHSISHDKKVEIGDLDAFNTFVSKSFSMLKIKRQRGKFTEGWNLESQDLHTITYPIVRDAYNLLLSDKHYRIRECPKCGWLFFDSSKNGKRRWCSMETCGSRSKAREWYNRSKGT